MALKKSELYSSLWQSCDELRGGMDASQYKDYVLVLLFISKGIYLSRDTLYTQSLTTRASWCCLGIGNSSICDNTLSNRSGNDRLKNRDAGVVPSAARPSKLCSTVHTW